jgi:hypothetical protein
MLGQPCGFHRQVRWRTTAPFADIREALAEFLDKLETV